MFKRFNGCRVVFPALCLVAWAASGCGGGGSAPRVVTEAATIDWLAPVEARDVFTAAYSHRPDSGPSNPDRSYTLNDLPLWLPRPDSAYPKEWGYWSAPYLSADIVKIQARPMPGTYASPLNDARAVYGILDHGIFWIASDFQEDGQTYFGAGYDYLDRNRYRLPPGGAPSDVVFQGATWTGDALGMVKASGTPVSGPAVLTVTSIEAVADRSHAYSLRLEADFRNVGVDRVRLDAASDAEGGFGGDLPADTGYRLQGTFLGSEAEEASGIFETPVYYGSFGVKR